MHLKNEIHLREKQNLPGRRIGTYLVYKGHESLYEHHKSFTFDTLLTVQTEVKANRAIRTRSLREQILLVNLRPARHKKQKPSSRGCDTKLSSAEGKKPLRPLLGPSPLTRALAQQEKRGKWDGKVGKTREGERWSEASEPGISEYTNKSRNQATTATQTRAPNGTSELWQVS